MATARNALARINNAGTVSGRTSAAVPQTANTPKPGADAVSPMHRRLVIEYLDLNDITPYPYNPRDNEKAIPSVAQSIKTFGFLVPCVVDDDNILVAGHTRSEAAKLLGLTEVPCVRATGLTPEEINAFRLIDNKVSEQAEWNFELLAGEMQKLEGMGLDFTEFGWTESEVSCLQDLVAADCLNAATLVQPEETATQQIRRSPVTARFVLGELVFMLPAAQYHSWVDGIRALCNFDEEMITAELKRRLGILD